MKTSLLALTALMTLPLVAAAQVPEPTPAFSGQTDAPAPAKPSPALAVQTMATGLTGAWSLAFLPDGKFLVTQSTGLMRMVRPDGVVSAPLAGLPPIKVAAAQGLHEVLLDPDFARNRTIYLSYFAPPRGEAPAVWPVTHFYQDVWTKPFTERRTMQLGIRARGAGPSHGGRVAASRTSRCWWKARSAASCWHATARC